MPVKLTFPSTNYSFELNKPDLLAQLEEVTVEA